MEVDKKTALAISEEIYAAADAIFARHGMARAKSRTKYGISYSLTIDANLVTLGENGINESTIEAQSYKALHGVYGLPDGLLGKKFNVNGKDYAFAGIATSRSKYPIYAKDLEEDKMTFFQESVKRFLVDA
jgi:hypothetical protein